MKNGRGIEIIASDRITYVYSKMGHSDEQEDEKRELMRGDRG